jgi:hypothetical protein
MMLFDEFDQCRGADATLLNIPEMRPSLLDPELGSEPWVDSCRREQLLILFLLNRPIALMAGSSLDHISLNRQLEKLRHRTPRQSAAVMDTV